MYGVLFQSCCFQWFWLIVFPQWQPSSFCFLLHECLNECIQMEIYQMSGHLWDFLCKVLCNVFWGSGLSPDSLSLLINEINNVFYRIEITTPTTLKFWSKIPSENLHIETPNSLFCSRKCMISYSWLDSILVLKETILLKMLWASKSKHDFSLDETWMNTVHSWFFREDGFNERKAVWRWKSGDHFLQRCNQHETVARPPVWELGQGISFSFPIFSNGHPTSMVDVSGF